MTELLAKALDRAQGLPEDEQDRVARLILDEVEAFGKENGEEEPLNKPFWERIVERSKEVPDEVWEELPKDGAAEIDHYLYGSPKRNS
ncbi:MAG: hypothetical protein IH820_10235 [Bacteroidetes bacterium]|nr:hypothetical protein [Bacteroidota bacterium]